MLIFEFRARILAVPQQYNLFAASAAAAADEKNPEKSDRLSVNSPRGVGALAKSLAVAETMRGQTMCHLQYSL
jgi:hypothetical protein